jgi:hypothetical protein
LPFGLIFAILMCSMMFGSLLYKHVSTSAIPLSPQKMLTGLLALASACFFVPGHFRDERLTLWCFCIFELCCGIYYPAMGSLKSKLVEDGSRASIYGILRIPLNVFVVLALSTTKDGKLSFCSGNHAPTDQYILGEAHRDTVFTTCSILLLVAAIVVHKTLT